MDCFNSYHFEIYESGSLGLFGFEISGLCLLLYYFDEVSFSFEGAWGLEDGPELLLGLRYGSAGISNSAVCAGSLFGSVLIFSF